METVISTLTRTAHRFRPVRQHLDETTLQRAEIMRLRVENEDLRASAELWLYLYDAALVRANALEARSASPDKATRDGT